MTNVRHPDGEVLAYDWGERADDMRTMNDGLSSWIRTFLRILKTESEKRSLPPITGPFLGLAAGEGSGEMALFKTLNSGKEPTTVLVDKSVDNPSDTFIESDIFEFLESWHGESFGFISLLSAEYAISSEENWNRLWHGIERVSRPETYVLLMPIEPGAMKPIPAGLKYETFGDDVLKGIGLIAIKK